MEYFNIELMNLDRKMGREDSKALRQEFAKLKTNAERYELTVKICLKYEVQPELQFEPKSAAKSESLRREGNALFVAPEMPKKMDEILELYTRSLKYAEPGSEEVSFAYGNRSALLFKARLYDHCLRDIDRALTGNCPKSLRSKLWMRRIHCIRALAESQPKRRKESFELIDKVVREAQEALEKLELDEETRKKWASGLRTSGKRFSRQRELFDEEKHKPPAPKDNPELPGVSSALKVDYDETFGRSVTATRKILPGELLCVQRGYATILMQEHFNTHCSKCLKQAFSPVPCDHCTVVVFCDEECRRKAWQEYHDVECQVLTPLLKLGLQRISLSSLRLVVRAVKEAGSFKALRKKIELLDESSDPRTKGFTGEPPVLDETDYSSVYALVTNEEKRSVPDLFGRAFHSVFIVYYLASLTDFLGEKLRPELKALTENPWSILVGGLILRHQQIYASNAHTVCEIVGLGDRERGITIQPFLSLINHSCDPSVVRIHYGTDIALYAIQTINPGQQVFDNYGAHYALNTSFERKTTLRKQYFFECRCVACQEDWQQFYDLPSYTSQVEDNAVALKLKNTFDKLEIYYSIAKGIEIEDKIYVIKDLEHMLEVFYENVKLPCLEVNAVVETLKRMYDLRSLRYQSLCSPQA